MSTVGMISSLLPELPGVRPLTRNEIKKDIGLIESYYDSDDSDTSVSSSEAITSSYPVKPRNFAKLPRRDDQFLESKVPHSRIDIGAGMSMDDAIEFMKAVETARPDVYEGEKERENLEIRYQAIREMCISQSDTFLTKKKEQKNFIRAVQGICRNRCQYFDVLSLKNSMMYDMITSLQRKKDDLAFLERSRAAVEEQAAGAEHTQKQKIISDAEKNSFHFYKHQCLKTPYGLGTIVNIDVKGEKVALQLPFGIMYSTFVSVVSWALKGAATDTPADAISVAALDVNHSDNLRQRWTQALGAPSRTVGMSDQRTAEVLQLLYTDKYPPSAPPPASASSSSSQQEATIAAAEVNDKQETRAKPLRGAAKSRRSSGRTKEAVLAGHETPPPSSSLPPVTTTASTSTIPVSVATSITNRATHEANMFANIEASKRSIYLNQTIKLPLLFCPPGLAPYLVGTYSGNYVTEKTLAKTEVSSEPISSSPPQSETSVSRITNKHYLQAEYCLKAFQRSKPVEFFCCDKADKNREDGDGSDTDSLAGEKEGADEELLPSCRLSDYDKQVVRLKDNLRPLLRKIKECRKRKRQIAQQVEITKLSTARISQQISKIRLGMFTRRVLYRQNLISKAEQENDHEIEPEEEAEGESRSVRSCVRGSKEVSVSAISSSSSSSAPSTSVPIAARAPSAACDKLKQSSKEAVSHDINPPEVITDPVPDTISSEGHQSTRRKSTRAAVVATSASSDMQSSSRSKRKKEEVSKEEDSMLPPPVSAAGAAKATNNSAAASSTASSSATVKRNPKRLRR